MGPKLQSIRWVASICVAASVCGISYGARIGDLTDASVGEQFLRFFTFQDASLRSVLIGSLCLGLCCGLLGSFIVVRRLSLVGDALSHAVLPGVAMGFLYAGGKDPLAIFIGATIAGVVGSVLVNLIKQTTHIKEDSALGMVLAGFYGIGIVLIGIIQNQPVGNKAGVDKFLFGQAAALSDGDVRIIGLVAVLSLLLVTVFYRQFLIGSFDVAFSKSLGIPSEFFHYLLMLLLAFAVVVSLQAVGAILVSAMLIIPAASAYLLTDRMHAMLALACLFGMVSGALGTFLSFLGNNLSTGPLMVIAASSLFVACFFFSPRHGMLSKWLRFRNQEIRIRDENTLKAIYHVRERNEFEGEGVSLMELAERIGESVEETQARVAHLRKADLGEGRESSGEPHVFLNPEGWLRACAVVRNHRLWELYLTNEADYEPDHVHDDAERIEHVLGESTVRSLERLLDYPRRDPHGKLIPSLADLQKALAPGNGTNGERATGFGRAGR